MANFDKQVNTIFVDMDGVIADFDEFVFKRMGRKFPHNKGAHLDKEMWQFLMTVDRLYFNLPPTKYANDLMRFVSSFGANVEILTAIPSRSKILSAEQDKKDWMNKYFGERYKVNIGPLSRDKHKHAKPGDILIDDRDDNIAEWNAAGGIGILHVTDDYANTVTMLNQLNL